VWSGRIRWPGGGLRGPGPRGVGRAADPRTPGAGRGGRVTRTA